MGTAGAGSGAGRGERRGGLVPAASPRDAVLQHGALAGALPAHHGDLRQVEQAVLAQRREGVLQPVDERDEPLHPAAAADR